MTKKLQAAFIKRQNLEFEVLAYLKMRSPTHRTMLHSRFDPYMTGMLNSVLADLEQRGLIERGPDNYGEDYSVRIGTTTQVLALTYLQKRHQEYPK